MERKVSVKTILAVLIVLTILLSSFAYEFYKKEPYSICSANAGKIEMNPGDYAVLTTTPDSLDENDNPRDGDSIIHFYEFNGDYKTSIFVKGIYESVHFDLVEEYRIGSCEYNIIVSKSSNDSRDFYRVDEYSLVKLKFDKNNKLDIKYSTVVSSDDEFTVYDTNNYHYPGLGNNYAKFLLDTERNTYIEVNGFFYHYSYFDQYASRFK